MSCSEKHYGFRSLDQEQPHCLINTESSEHESTETHLAWGRKYNQTRRERMRQRYLFGSLAYIWSFSKQLFNQVLSILQHRGKRGKIQNIYQWQTTVKHWFKHLKYGGSVYCRTLAFWKNLHFKSSAAVGLWRWEKGLMLTFSDSSTFQVTQQ